MYIEPNTNIKILKDVPLDTTYDHTIYFSSASAQTNYFAGLTKYNLTSQTYQRVKRGYARVQRKAEDLYDCNYMMFQNSAYGNKWFYAFITSVEYVNNVTSEITFEIDDMQTWFFDFTLDMCYVEREHSVTDEIGDNIMPESVECGEYVYNFYQKFSDIFDAMGVVIAYVDTGEASTNGVLCNGIYSGAHYKMGNASDVDRINSFITNYAQSPDSVLAMYMCPIIVGTEEPIEEGVLIDFTNTKTGWHNEWSYQPASKAMALDGYTPKNAKLYTYPYNYFMVDNGSGNSLILRYEFFKDLTPTFDIESVNTMPVKITMFPKNYKHETNEIRSESITLENFPQCSWNIDAYKVWYAQNALPRKIETAFSMGTAIGATGAFAMAPNLITGGIALQKETSYMNQIKQNMLDQYKASISADIFKGSLSNSNLNLAQSKQTFFISRPSISADYAKTIDDYFTRYGYATKKLKTPNTHSRPHWNFVKTIGCTATGSIPADAMRHICSIHDSGITYWKNGNEIGNYSLDNSPS